MLFMFVIVMMLTALSFILSILFLILSMKESFKSATYSPFECGFLPMESARLPFSLNFFLLSVLFLMFDIELILLFPLLMTSPYVSSVKMGVSAIAFIVFISISTLYEWNLKSLEWGL